MRAISPRLVQRLLNDVGEDPDQLPILQHALMRTWQHWEAHRDARPMLDLQDYEDIGTMSDALSRDADEAYDEIDGERGRSIAEALFKRLTERGPDTPGDPPSYPVRRALCRCRRVLGRSERGDRPLSYPVPIIPGASRSSCRCTMTRSSTSLTKA